MEQGGDCAAGSSRILRRWRRAGRPCRLRGALTALCLVALTACAPGTGPEVAPRGPEIDDALAETPVVTPPDAETLAAVEHYRQIEANYLSQGLLQSGGGRDIGFSADMLARNFLAIAFHDEFSESGDQLIPSGRESRLHRWERPIRVAIEFGPSVPLDNRAADRAEIAAYLARLSAITGLVIRQTTSNANFLILVQSPAERRGARDRILRFAPSTSDAALALALDMRKDIYCAAFSNSPRQRAYYDRSLIIVRSELPALMRRACLHEEIAQGLGLVNDSPAARPSIFNDAGEFALLTVQDELMLKILYDPRLRPGMSLAEARPIVDVIARELMPGES